jgi:lysophospholipase L1-like esterase
LPLVWVNEKTEIWQTEIFKRRQVVRKLAGIYNATFLVLQKPLNEACQKDPANYWIWDGVNPMPAGHELIARRWKIEVLKS